MTKYKKLCSDYDCFNNVVIDEFTERYQDGRIHPLALKCGVCITSEEIKKLKRFRKVQRKKLMTKDKQNQEWKEKVLWCDGGKECHCICHQTDYPLPKDFPTPESRGDWAKTEAGQAVNYFLSILEPWFHPGKEWDNINAKANEFLFEDLVIRFGNVKKAAHTEGIEEVLKKVESLIVDEALICYKENTPTSRLTSLMMKVKDLKTKETKNNE